ncbi:MAG: hypothetical protein HY563_07175 [Ignavibacteriales bacterium]|nr:hypothetical protein [Ignavibacteriales bacterium]
MANKRNKKPTYHIVSHSHWDREWYFPFDRFRAMLVEMIEDLLEIFRKDPEFRSYTLDGQLAAVMDYLEIRPDRRNVLRDLVRKKKLFIGPWYILQDEFLASGEGQIRNLQFGIRFGKALGGVMKIGYIPDQFSHIAQMPQILQGFGLDAAMFYRGFGGEPGQEPSEYLWISPNGSRVLLHHMPRDGYSAGYFGTEDEETIVRKFGRMQKELDARATTSQRLFFNGGDHHWPDEAVTTAMRILRKRTGVALVHSNIPEFFARVKKEVTPSALPLLEGESRFGYRHAFVVQGGVYSSRMYLKQMNAECETLLERFLEPLNVLASFKGSRSKTPQIEQAWKYVIQNHDHDAICGTSTDEVHREMVVRYEKAKQIGAFVLQDCLSALLPSDELAKGDDQFVFVFNPSPFARSETVEATVEFYLQDVVVGLNPDVRVAPKRPSVAQFRLEDARGKAIRGQILDRKEAYGIVYSRHDYPSQTLVDRFTVLVEADDLPALGWKGYKIKRDAVPAEANPVDLTCGEQFLENNFLRVDIRPDGAFAVTDKSTGVHYDQLNYFEDSGDVGDEYNYSYPEQDQIVASGQPGPRITLTESGPLRASIRIEHVMNVPVAATKDERARLAETTALRIASTVTLTLHARKVDVRTEVQNNILDHRLRAVFRTGIDTTESLAETPFAVVRRQHREYDVRKFPYEHPALVAPMRRFVTVRDEQKGLTFLSRGLPEYELSARERGVVALTLLRCVGKLSGRNLITRPGGAAGWWTETPEAQCLGTHTFEYALVPHEGNESTFWPAVLREAERFTVTSFAVNRKNDQRVLEQSWFSLEGDLQLSAIKEAEDKKGIIVRLCNPVRRPVQGTLWSLVPIRKAFLCRLDETPLKSAGVARGHSIKIRLKPYEIATVRLHPELRNSKA